MPDPSISLNWERIQAGDLSAYEVLFKQYFNQIYQYALKYVSDQVAAEEIAQEVFMYIWEKREKIHIESSLVSYLYSAARNKSINYLKLELPRINASKDVYEIEIGDEVTVHDVEENSYLRKSIRAAIETLPTKCKEIFMMSRYEGLTYDEIAEELELSKKTVENQMGIALKKLRESLKPVMDRIKE